MVHEIGNRTYIVADVDPLDVDGVRTLAVGTASVAARVPALLPFYGRLERRRPPVVAVDLPGRLRAGPPRLEYCRRRRNRRRKARQARRTSQPRPGWRQNVLEVVVGERCRRPGRAAAAASCFLAQLRLGVGAAAVVEGDHPAVVVGELVGADAEQRRQRPGQPDQEAAGRAQAPEPTGPAARRALRRRRTSAAAARSRPSRDSTRARPRPSSSAISCCCGSSALVDEVVARVAAQVGRNQPRVVLVDGQQVAGRQVAGLDPLAPRHPGRAR